MRKRLRETFESTFKSIVRDFRGFPNFEDFIKKPWSIVRAFYQNLASFRFLQKYINLAFKGSYNTNVCIVSGLKWNKSRISLR